MKIKHRKKSLRQGSLSWSQSPKHVWHERRDLVGFKLRRRVDDGGNNNHDRVIEVVVSFNSVNGKAQSAT